MSVAVEVVDQIGLGQIEGPVSDLVKAVLEVEGAQGAVVVAFVDEQAITRLNAEYRGLEEATDVLSFRYADGAAGWPEREASPDLGEVIVCPAVVRRYADEEGGSASTQLGWTLIHGILHLVGYDHEHDDGQMREREQDLLGRLGLLVEAISLSETNDTTD